MNKFVEVFFKENIDAKMITDDLVDQLENAYGAFYQLLSSIPGSFLLISPDGKIIAASKLMREKFIQRQDIINLNYTDITYPFFKESSKDGLISGLIRQSLEKGLDFERVLIEGTSYKDEEALLELNLQVIRNQEGKISSVMMNFVEDIVRQNILPGNLEKDQKLKKLGSLSAGLVHEIKNPMQSISSIIQLLQIKYPNDKSMQDYLESAMTEIHRVSVILSEFLTFSGNNQEYMCYTNVNEICEDVLKIIYGNCYMNEIELVTNLAEDIPDMVLDIGRMKQVIVNLVTNSVDAINALRYTDDFDEKYPNFKGLITISTSYNFDLNECYIVIEDNGIGMDEKTVKSITKPFFTTKRYGTGIGISISTNIIKNHGGRLKIESEYGKGSTFTVILPELAGLMEMVVKKSNYDKNIGILVSDPEKFMIDDYDL